MTRLLVLYRKPADAAAFDSYYHQHHVPLAKTLGGLRGYEVSEGPIGHPQGESDWHLVASLGFDSPQALQAALMSPEGQATAADLANFAGAGVEMLIFNSREL